MYGMLAELGASGVCVIAAASGYLVILPPARPKPPELPEPSERAAWDGDAGGFALADATQAMAVSLAPQHRAVPTLHVCADFAAMVAVLTAHFKS